MSASQRIDIAFMSLGSGDRWLEYDCRRFPFGGRSAVVVRPPNPRPDGAFVWRARFFGAFPGFDEEMLQRGYWLVHVDIADLFGGSAAMSLWDDFYAFLTGELGLRPRPFLEGMSRGGLAVCHWAWRCPGETAGMYLDAPVCDIGSWPHGASAEIWSKALSALGLTVSDWRSYGRNPADLAPALAERGVPLALVYGDADTTVPWHENGARLAAAYRAAGAPIAVWGKPGCGHHPHGLPDMAPVCDFLEEHCKEG